MIAEVRPIKTNQYPTNAFDKAFHPVSKARIIQRFLNPNAIRQSANIAQVGFSNKFGLNIASKRLAIQ